MRGAASPVGDGSYGTRAAGAADGGLERAIGRLLSVGTLASMASIAVGVAGMAATGRSPLDVAPALDITRLPADLVARHPFAFLWLGLVGLVATPSARVFAALVGYLRGGERAMAVVAGLVLLVVALGVLAGTARA